MWWQVNMKIQAVTLSLLAAFYMAGAAAAGQMPFEKVEALEFNFKYKGHGRTAVFAAGSLPYLLVEENGGVYWLLNMETSKPRVIADNEVAGIGSLVIAAHWGNDHIALFQRSQGLVKRVNPKDPNQSESIPAELQSAPLRSFIWLGERQILIDGVNTYVMREGVLTKMSEQNSHVPTQSGLVVVDEQHYVTSGYEDQTLRLYSLPSGELLNEWRLGRWYSSRKITSIAVVNGRLLVASAGGRIEERSLDNGEVLWSARPCREGVSFFHSSHQQQSHNSEFRRKDSINVNDKIFYGCGNRFGTLERKPEGWQVEPLQRTLGIEGWLANVEMIPNTDLAVLVIAQDESWKVYVVDHYKKAMLQQLENTQDYNPGPVTYVAATNQLVLVGESDELYLYDLTLDE
jgi:hypothetical protein